ncbi:uncharacterized protein LOC123006347 [Tribolium madens]|uniref:uncharacterized protein LOC123006347 n=1 Tax=Tribolium madens TaxID=41895 RepID=UPI001CF75117|nr:uncharacterized protein LOC123006347 [Tribolium madens]
MFGSKLRSWMEAVRPRKKQHRKEKQTKANLNPNTVSSNWQNGNSCGSSQDDLDDRKGNTNRKITNGVLSENGQASQAPATRYSANNLSSPESAYSTGYSTDGTSPGAPPDYYINIRTGVKYFPSEGERYNHENHLKHVQQHRVPNGTDLALRTKPPTSSTCLSPPIHSNRRPIMQSQEVAVQSHTAPAFQCNTPVTSSRLSEVVASPVLTSPRQRNRIRTNPWVPGSTLSPGQIRQEMPKITTAVNVTDSPISRRFLSPSTLRGPSLRNQSLSSSSCSSLSGASIHWDAKKPSASDEDDCTLNEMMGKYDESYVYEKENDILSDSDPTDCDTDIDTGQDGGDEDEPIDGEFDFIDNGSYLELDPREDRNTGHCTYYNFEVQRKASRRRTTRRSKQCSEKRRRSSSNKKRHKQIERVNIQPNGSKSAGATPLSVRRTKHHPMSKLALDDCLKKRSNSISFSRDDPFSTIDKRDKEADQKYRELIVEAEHILRSMKTNGLSPRRVPGPANKRVEILRSAECAKPELFMKNRLIEEPGPPFTKIPSSNFNCSRFSPKRNHITNFMISNSPALMRRDMELPTSPLAKRPDSPKLRANRRSPKYRKKSNKVKVQECPTSSDSDGEGKVNDAGHGNQTDSVGFGCPQSEPVRRKVYSGRGKTVAFNLNYENIYNNSPPYSPTRFEAQEYKSSAENLRQQVLMNTIANLKKSLEDQSASLKQVYRSSHNIQL